MFISKLMKRFIFSLAGLLGFNSTQEIDLRPKIQTLTELVSNHIATENTLYTTDLDFGDIKTSETALEDEELIYRVNVVNDDTTRPGFFVWVYCKNKNDRRCKNEYVANAHTALSVFDYDSDGTLELFLEPKFRYNNHVTSGSKELDARMEKRAVRRYEELLDSLLEFYEN